MVLMYILRFPTEQSNLPSSEPVCYEMEEAEESKETKEAKVEEKILVQVKVSWCELSVKDIKRLARVTDTSNTSNRRL